jgi:hypothetical protein
VSSVDVALARHQWEEGSRRLEATRESQPGLYLELVRLLDVVISELRGRIGQTFTQDELVAAYDRAEDWSRTAIADSEPPPGWPRYLSLLVDSAFNAYARGATDFEP